MINQKEITLELNDRIKRIKQDIKLGKISLLDLELEVLFNQMSNLIEISNLEHYSAKYVEICALLEQKFEDLKFLLKSIDEDQKIIDYLKSNLDDIKISDIFKGCWREIFYIEDLSLKFLIYATNRFTKEKFPIPEIKHQKRILPNEAFLIEIPEIQFIERLDQYYDKIKEILPCNYDQIFEGEKNQIKVYEQFIYLLHLLQLGRIKYHKETNMLYL